MERTYLRGPDDVVHRVSGFGISDLTYCGREVNTMYEREDPRSLAQQLVATPGPPTCILCLDSENNIENEPIGHVMNVDSFDQSEVLVQTWGSAPWQEGDDDE